MFPVRDGKFVGCVERLLVGDLVNDSHSIPHPDPLTLDHLACGVHDVTVTLELALAIDLSSEVHDVVLDCRPIVAADGEAQEVVREELS